MNQTKERLKFQIEMKSNNNSELEHILYEYLDKIESELHRYYHTLEHVWNVYQRGSEYNLFSLIFAITHDLVYNPRSKTNEEDSIEYIRNDISPIIGSERFSQLSAAIMDTKDLTKVTSFNTADRYDVIGYFPELVQYFKLIKKEYESYNYVDFVEGHLDVIMKIREAHKSNVEVSKNYRDHVLKYCPTVAIYTGSFDPFHLGHYKVVLEAEKIFDKVIIAKGFNPNKTDAVLSNEIVQWKDVPSTLWCKETVIYCGTIFDLYDHFKTKYPKVVFIKGFRNATDIEYDMNQVRVTQELNPNIHFSFIPCAPGTEHISSSMIRNLRKLNLVTDKFTIK